MIFNSKIKDTMIHCPKMHGWSNLSFSNPKCPYLISQDNGSATAKSQTESQLTGTTEQIGLTRHFTCALCGTCQ